MKNIFKATLALACTMTAFAQDAQTTPMPAQMDPNPCARFGTKDSGNFFIQGEVLWIKPLGMNFSSNQQDVNGATTSQSYFSNEFTTGERVSIGYNTSYDGWDAILEFTGFNYHHNNAGISYYKNSTSNVTGTTAYTYYFNQGDLDFGRMMKISRKVKMRPHVGARVLWLNENAKFTSSTNSYSLQKNKNTLGGLELGLDSIWMFAKEFGVYANLGLTTLVNQQKTLISNNGAPLDAGYNTNYGSKIVSGYDIKVGIRWDKNFSDDSYHFGINFGYEQHSLININGINGILGETNGGSGSLYQGIFDSDFTWQAIALGARFDF
jgi:Legionella pneumophila major outer membrane protein precursor